MKLSDVAPIIAIEEASFQYPWSHKEFFDFSQQKHCNVLVAVHKKEVIGYIAYEIYDRRHIHLSNMAVAEKYRRLGVGTELIAKVSEKRRNNLEAEVRESNLVAQMFLREMGFKATIILRDLYDETDEDAYLMRLEA